MDIAAPPRPPGALRLAGRALLFGEDAFAQARSSPTPLGFGIRLALLFAFVAGFAQAIGTGFDFLVSPQPEQVKPVVLENLQGMAWYRDLTSGPDGAEFRRQFEQAYEWWWRTFPSVFGVPSVGGAVSQAVLLPLLNVAGWLIVSLLVFACARLLGGRASFGVTLAALGLATAPNLLLVVSIWPGADVSRLVGWWSLALSYWAVVTAHELSWGRALLAVLLPRVLIALLALAAVGVLALALALGAGGGG